MNTSALQPRTLTPLPDEHTAAQVAELFRALGDASRVRIIAALETADVTIMDDDLRKLPELLALSKRAARILTENITLAIGIKAVFFVLTLFGQATLWMAAPRTTPNPDPPVTRRAGNRLWPHGSRVGLTLVALFGLLMMEARRVQAHSDLVSSDPAPGAVLASPPAEVSLVFSEPLDEGTSVDVIDSSFQSKRSGAPLRDFHDPLRVSVAVAGILTGTYTVEWTAIAVDSDVTRGSFAFEVQGDSASAPRDAAGRIGLPDSSLWLAVALVAVVIGFSFLLGRQDRGLAHKG